jgi:predicted PurR-regulated permease PerM
LSPLVIILALFAGGQLFGLLGIFLAVPAAAAVRVLARHSYQAVMER